MKLHKLYQIFKIFFKVFGLNRKIDSYFRLKDFIETVDPLYFYTQKSSFEDKKNFFKRHLIDIELETHAFCNRKCSFCPNVSLDRQDNTKILPEGPFKQLIDELEEIDYQGSIKFHRFNEPLANEIIFDRIQYSRKKLPKALLGFHSNGDYIKQDVLDRLQKIGLNFIHISLYIDYSVPRNKIQTIARNQAESYFKNHKLKSISIKPNGELVKYKIPMENMEVILFIPDINVLGNDRGGYLESLHSRQKRTSPCISPFSGVYIDWTGDVLPCCNLRGDISEHKSYIMGNIKESSLQDMYFSNTANKIRKMLVDYSVKKGVCEYCGYDLFYDGLMFRKVMDKKLKNL